MSMVTLPTSVKKLGYEIMEIEEKILETIFPFGLQLREHSFPINTLIETKPFTQQQTW